MTKIISHRGNIIGPITNKENRPSYIDCALQLGLDVEVDIRYIDGKYWLGHDKPDYEVSETWILNRKNNLWFHCKDLNSAHALGKLDNTIIRFCHSTDDFVLVSNNTIWVHNLKLELNSSSIIPLMSIWDIIHFNNNYTDKIIHGICTDYPSKLS